MSTTTLNAPREHVSTPSRAASSTPERYNIYLGIHKALRSFMCDTLCRIGRVDTDDADEFAATLAQLDTLLALCTSHIEHEEDFLHRAIEARQPAGSTRTAADHQEHVDSIATLRAQAAALAAAPAPARPALALRLYRHLALFVAENLQHMQIEETVNAATLWAHYSDAELHALHQRLLATLPPQQHLLVARWLVPALSPAERADLLGAMKPQTPPEAFLGVLAHVQPHVDAIGWIKLTRAIGMPQAPGLVNIP